MPTKNILLIFAALAAIIGGVAVYTYFTMPADPVFKVRNSSGYGVCDQPGDDNCAVAVSGEKDTPNDANIKVSPPSFNLGTVIYGEVASHNFTITNQGSEPVQILKISTSCGCTKAAVAEEDKMIAAGKSVNMLVTFDPAVHKDDSDLGEVVRVVYITTDDPDIPEVEVRINANVIKAAK